MRIDIMTDIETLGHRTDSTIIQIAAIAFNIETGNYFSEFNQIVDVTKNEELKVTGSTLKWWLNTNKELLSELINKGDVSSYDLINNFHQWMSELNGELYLWGNGILFDNKMIQYQMETLGLEYPINYKNDRDLRTIIDLTSNKLNISEKELKDRFNDECLVKHDAFHDVRYQIHVLSWCYRNLTGF